MSQTRRLAAILAADVAGYSQLMGTDEEGTLERLKSLRYELVDPKIAAHHGRIVKTTGDGLLTQPLYWLLVIIVSPLTSD
jgi:class 3 adenylate cyclase